MVGDKTLDPFFVGEQFSFSILDSVTHWEAEHGQGTCGNSEIK